MDELRVRRGWFSISVIDKRLFQKKIALTGLFVRVELKFCISSGKYLEFFSQLLDRAGNTLLPHSNIKAALHIGGRRRDMNKWDTGKTTGESYPPCPPPICLPGHPLALTHWPETIGLMLSGSPFPPSCSTATSANLAHTANQACLSLLVSVLHGTRIRGEGGSQWQWYSAIAPVASSSTLLPSASLHTSPLLLICLPALLIQFLTHPSSWLLLS